MPPEHLLDPWKSFFAEMDAALNQEVALHCLGGFVAKVIYDLARETSDVDVLPIASNNEIDSVISMALEGFELHKKYGVYLQVVGVATIPEGYESRLTEMFPGTSNIFASLRSTLTTLRSQRSNATVSAIETMLSISRV